MSLAFRQLKVYLRIALVVLIGIGVALVLFKNRAYSAGFWFFWLRDDETQPVNVVWLMLCTAIGTLLTWWVLSIAWGLIRDWRELKRLRANADLAKAQAVREAELTEREKRLQEKLDTLSHDAPHDRVAPDDHSEEGDAGRDDTGEEAV